MLRRECCRRCQFHFLFSCSGINLLCLLRLALGVGRVCDGRIEIHIEIVGGVSLWRVVVLSWSESVQIVLSGADSWRGELLSFFFAPQRE